MAPVRFAPLKSAPLKFAPVRSARAPPSLPEKNLSCASRISETRRPLCLIDLGFFSPIVHSPTLDSTLHFTGIMGRDETHNLRPRLCYCAFIVGNWSTCDWLARGKRA